jgi:hypothetical protein
MTTIRTKRKQITVSHLYMHPIILQGVACQTMSEEALPEREREREREREKRIENWLGG